MLLALKEHPRIRGIPASGRRHPAVLERREPLCHRRRNLADSAFDVRTPEFLRFLKPQDGIRRAGSSRSPSRIESSRGVMVEPGGLMRGKRGLILGVANNRSLAWGIAKAARAHGAELAFTYQGEALKKRVEPLAAELGGLVAGHCDVTEEASLDRVFAAVAKAWGSLDFIVH